jgi:hypothetical protein
MPMELETRTIIPHPCGGFCPDCPEVCETCDGEGFVIMVPCQWTTFRHDDRLSHDVVMGGLWTHILIPKNQDCEIACPTCGGEGSVY